jgi:hypothetical protein
MLSEDEARVEVIAKRLISISDKLKRDGNLWGDVVVVGLGIMFESSEFPVPIDPVLREGFSPDQWFAQAPQGSSNLAVSVARLWWKPNLSRISAFSDELGVASYKNPSEETLDRIERVLNWPSVLKGLEKRPVMVLGLAWLTDHMITREGIAYPETESDVQGLYWNGIEALLDSNKAQLSEETDRMIARIVASNTGPAWAEIIRFPW